MSEQPQAETNAEQGLTAEQQIFREAIHFLRERGYEYAAMQEWPGIMEAFAARKLEEHAMGYGGTEFYERLARHNVQVIKQYEEKVSEQAAEIERYKPVGFKDLKEWREQWSLLCEADTKKMYDLITARRERDEALALLSKLREALDYVLPFFGNTDSETLRQAEDRVEAAIAEAEALLARRGK